MATTGHESEVINVGGLIASLQKLKTDIIDVKYAKPSTGIPAKDLASGVIPSSLPANGGNAATVNSHSVAADVPSDAVFTDTTYTFTGGTNKITVTPSGGTPQDVTITPSISNNVTASGNFAANAIIVGNAANKVAKNSGVTISTTAPSGDSTDTTVPTSKAVWSAVANGIAANDAMVYKGTVAGGSTGNYGALTPAASKGETYKVTTAGKIDGIAVEIGDMLICNTDSTAAATSSNYSTIAAKWDFIQTNIDGAVTGPASSTDGNLASYNGATGKVVKDSGLTTTNVSDAVSKKHEHSNITLSTTAQAYDGTHTIALPSSNPYTNTHKITVGSGYKSDGTTAITATSASAAATPSVTLGDSGVTAGSYGDSAAQTPSHGGKFKVPYVTVNAKGIVTGISSHDVTLPASGNTDRYVNSASFADDTTANANNPVKMTLTRAGSDTATVTGNLPKVSSSSAGVVPKGASVSSQSQSTKFLREDGSWAAPSYTAAQVQSDWNASSGMGKILNKPTLGTAAEKDVPTSGNASTSQVVMGNDTRLSDARTPSSHTHGNIANGGTLTDTAAAAAGNDYVVIRDASDNKIQTSTIKGTDVADSVSKKHEHSTLTLSTTAQAYDGTHTLALPSSDPYSSARTPSSHTHGNIQNDGKLQTTDVAIASGDKLVVTDASNSNKVARTSVSFDGSTTTKALTQKGTFETFAASNTTYKLNINGTNQGGGSTSLGTVYAPTSAGTQGQMLIANASGIPAWGSKPAYTLSEVGASMSVVAISADTSSVCGITGAGNSGKSETIIYTNSSGADLTVTVPTTYVTPDGAAIELTCPNGGYCEVNYLNIGGTIYARGL